ncbi:MAG: sensor domain-containing diguanylate cyclase [Candidatus Omnitrophota bacterium]
MYKNYVSIVYLSFLLILTSLFLILDKTNLVFFIVVCVISIVIFIIFDRKAVAVFQNAKMKIDELEAQVNLLEEELKQKNIILRDLPPKAERVFSIKTVVEEFVQFIEPEELANSIVRQIEKIFPEADNVLLFLFDRQKDTLDLSYSFRRNNEIIREKKGDTIDWWVLRNNQSLFIEDLSGDYRMDFTAIYAYKERGVRSLVSSPFSIGTKIYGVLRLESKKIKAFSLEDSRMARVICDLGTVILERAYLFNTIKDLATKDSLTDLFLRNYFFERLEEEIKRASLKRTHFGLVILDIDNFKAINDTHGHTVGDLVLKRLSAILKRNIGDSGNIVARMGGEEFIFCLVESDKDEVKKIADKIRQDADRNVISFRRKKIHFTVSMGVAIYYEDGMDSSQLVAAADRLLYEAKRTGKDKICFT